MTIQNSGLFKSTISIFMERVATWGMNDLNYKDNDDLQLYDSVIEELTVNHKMRTIEFRILKVISRIDRKGGFTYKVNPGVLRFIGVVFSNINYGIYWNEWSEFYRSAILGSSDLLERVKKYPLKDEVKDKLKHIYLGIDNGNNYKEIDIVCIDYSLSLEKDDFILHDDFPWLFEDKEL